MDPVIHHDQNATPFCIGIGGNGDGVIENPNGPSALTAVDGRIEPTSTTGLSLFTTRLRKSYLFSSMVSVPCVTTMPSTSGFASSSLMRLASVNMMLNDMSCEPTLETCSPVMLARSLIPGTAAIIASMVTAPDV